MGLFRKLFGRGAQPPDRPDMRPRDERPEWIQGMEAQLLEGRVDLEVVGESNYQDNLWRAVGGQSHLHERVRVDVYAVLRAETDNPYDRNAVSVWVSGRRVGYFSRADAERYRPGLLALEQKHGKPIALPGVIVGGGIREDGPGRLGVFLRHDPTDFGLIGPEPTPAAGARMMTGLTDAIATDAADDNYDLSWVAELPGDPIRAISMLRRLLQDEPDPIDRHFMFHHLEEALYRYRDAFTSALDEYDECCRQHDAEMETIGAAFVAKWGQIPWLHTYKQMCIRLAKAQDFERALWWAERGLALYGENAARRDAVEDLQKRADTYRAKLTSPKPRSAGPRGPKEPEMETLTCANCGRAFQRLGKRGRKPTLCPDCRAEAGNSSA